MIGIDKRRRINGGLLAVCALISVLLPTRFLFACDLMGGETLSQCCCEAHGTNGCALGGGCDTHGDAKTALDAADGQCCAISANSPPVYDSATGSHGQIGVGALITPAQPPPAIHHVPLAAPPPGFIPPGALLAIALPAASGPSTLLVTQRFRI